MTDILRRPYSARQIEALKTTLSQWSAQQVQSGNDTSIRQHIDSIITAWRGIDATFPIREALHLLLEQHIIAWSRNRGWTRYFLMHSHRRELASDARLGPLLKCAADQTRQHGLFSRAIGKTDDGGNWRN